MFEEALRRKLRFNYKGNLTVEDLWDLSLEQLNELYGILMKKKRSSVTDSLISESAEDKEFNLKIEIVKNIFNVLSVEQQTRIDKAQNKAKRDRIDAIIARKQEKALEDMSIEELERMRADYI